MTDYRRFDRKALLLAFRERYAERKRIVALLMSKAETERARGTIVTALGFDQLALELGQMEHDPDLVEAAREKGVTHYVALRERNYADKQRGISRRERDGEGAGGEGDA